MYQHDIFVSFFARKIIIEIDAWSTLSPRINVKVSNHTYILFYGCGSG